MKNTLKKDIIFNVHNVDIASCDRVTLFGFIFKDFKPEVQEAVKQVYLNDTATVRNKILWLRENYSHRCTTFICEILKLAKVI